MLNAEVLALVRSVELGARKRCHNAAGTVAPPAWASTGPCSSPHDGNRQGLGRRCICACACAGVFIVRPAGLDGQVAAAPQQPRVFGASRCQRRRAAAPAAKRSWGLEGVHATTREWQVRLMQHRQGSWPHRAFNGLQQTDQPWPHPSLACMSCLRIHWHA